MEPETEKKALRMIAAGLEGEEGDGKTLLQLLRKEDYRKDIALLLAGPKDQKKYAAYMDNMDNNLGANAIQDDLRNLVFGKDERTIRKFDGLTNKQKDVVNSNLGALLRLHDDPLFKLAMALEKIALEDDYFVARKLYPNVDFYSGIVQRAIGIPVPLFTAIFALARTVGWMTQWEEMISDPEYKIGRPRQLYVGAAKRDVVPLAQRG